MAESGSNTASQREAIDAPVERIAYLSPFSNPGNAYIEIQKKMLKNLGFCVQPFELRLLRDRRHWRALRDRRNVIVIHWLESRPFLDRAPGRTINPRGFAAWLAYCVVLLLARARSVYVIHNHHAHDTSGRARRWSAHLTRWLCRIVDTRVVHDPNACAQYDACYWPHPLYRSTPPAPRPSTVAPLFGIVGSVRPYKGIDGLLRAWPRATPLLIAGQASEEQRRQIETLLTDCRLQENVATDLRFLDKNEFDATLERIDVLVLPHHPHSVIVSGAFFEAIGRVPLILARENSFTRWAAGELPGIKLFSDDAQLPALIADIEQHWPQQTAESARDRAEELFGWEACRAACAEILRVH